MEDKTPGAELHSYSMCPTPNLIRPGLYAYWKGAPEGLRKYVLERASVEWNSVGGFTRWLKGSDARTKMPNHVQLFWWIVMYWEQ